MREVNDRFPGSVRLFAPSETTAARAQLGSRRIKTDHRDGAALTYLARQGQGRRVPDQVQDALAAAVRRRRGMKLARLVNPHRPPAAETDGPLVEWATSSCAQQNWVA